MEEKEEKKYNWKSMAIGAGAAVVTIGAGAAIAWKTGYLHFGKQKPSISIDDIKKLISSTLSGRTLDNFMKSAENRISSATHELPTISDKLLNGDWITDRHHI